MNSNIYPCILMLLCVFAGSAKKETGSSSSFVHSRLPTVRPAGHDVYFVGMDSGRACYWKNGVKTAFGWMTLGMGIAVDGQDVYVSGASVGGRALKAVLWKNGVESDLSDSFSMAYPPVVAGGDVYVPGYVGIRDTQLRAVYWKDGQQMNLDRSLASAAFSMAVSGNNVYAVGGFGGPHSDTTVLWKNGVRVPASYSIDKGQYTQVFFNGPNLYIVGLQGYSRNGGAFVSLPTAQGTTALAISGSDVYVSGYREDPQASDHAVYWKNGKAIELPNFKGTVDSKATGVAVVGSDVYVSGTVRVNRVQMGVFWKNGVEVVLSHGGACNQVVTE